MVFNDLFFGNKQTKKEFLDKDGRPLRCCVCEEYSICKNPFKDPSTSCKEANDLWNNIINS